MKSHLLSLAFLCFGDVTLSPGNPQLHTGPRTSDANSHTHDSFWRNGGTTYSGEIIMPSLQVASDNGSPNTGASHSEIKEEPNRTNRSRPLPPIRRRPTKVFNFWKASNELDNIVRVLGGLWYGVAIGVHRDSAHGKPPQLTECHSFLCRDKRVVEFACARHLLFFRQRGGTYVHLGKLCLRGITLCQYRLNSWQQHPAKIIAGRCGGGFGTHSKTNECRGQNNGRAKILSKWWTICSFRRFRKSP